MKKTYTIFLLLLLLMLHLNAMAQKAKAITINEVPAAVQEAFATESMSSVQKWEQRTLKNGQVRYVAFYTEANFKARLFINEKGEKIRRIYATAEGGNFNELCNDAAKKVFPNQTIQGQEMVYLFATKLQYIRVILKNGEKRTFFRCDTNGNPLVDTNEEED